MTVKDVMDKCDHIGHFLDDIVTAGDEITLKTGDMMTLCDILTDYRDMLLDMKVKC